jgi:hypothetical protein
MKILITILLFFSLKSRATIVEVTAPYDGWGWAITHGIDPDYNGDTIRLHDDHKFAYITMVGYSNITIIRMAGQRPRFSNGFSFIDCYNMIVDGTGEDGIRGIYINQESLGGSGVAVSVAGYSKKFLFKGIEVDTAGYGSWLKNEHFCDPGLTDWLLDSVEWDDFEMHHLEQHGFYYGPTEQINVSRPVTCDDGTHYYNPSQIGHVKIHDGYIHNIGKNGVMISNHTGDTALVYNMIIDTTGFELQEDQGTGISIGGRTRRQKFTITR